MARTRGLVWAMEELEEQVVEEVPAEPLAADSLETDMLEANDQVGEIDDMNTSVEEAEEDADTLEDIASVMDESTQNGGMDQVSARVAEVAVESIYKRLGVRKSKGLPAMESFGAKGTRMSATKIAVEGVREVLKTIWEKIKAAAEKVWGWIKSFWQAICNTAGKLKDRAGALLAKVKGLKGLKAESDKVDLGSTGAAVAVDGKSDAASLNKGLDELVKAVEGTDKTITSLGSGMNDTDLEKVAETGEGVEKLAPPAYEFVGWSKVENSEDNTWVFTSPAFPGHGVFTFTVPGAAKGEAYLIAQGLMDVEVGNMNKLAKEDSSVSDAKIKYEVETASPEEMEAVCEKVGIIAKIAEASKSVMAKISSVANSFITMLKNIGSKVVEGAKELGSKCQKAFSTMSRAVSKFISTWFNKIVASGKACLDWVEKHYAAYKAKKANKEAGITEVKPA